MALQVGRRSVARDGASVSETCGAGAVGRPEVRTGRLV
jgi:hypothetical protein